jgi:hypothetical protein
LSHGSDADCPPALATPNQLTGRFHTPESGFGTPGVVINGFGNLRYAHRPTRKRQFAQDKLAYGPAHASARGFPFSRSGAPAVNLASEYLHRRLKPFCAGFHEPGFLGLLFAQREGCPSLSF